MKTIRNALILALLISLSLNTYLFLRPDSKTVRTAPPVAISSPSNPQSSPPQSTDRFDWRKVESPDYRKYIANLRLIGVPEETIRDLIVADVCQLYKAKWQHLLQAN